MEGFKFQTHLEKKFFFRTGIVLAGIRVDVSL